MLGQVNILFAVIATATFLAMRSGREVSAGALVALAIVIKPYAVLFLPWLVARRRLPSVVSACVGLAVVLALPAALYGWEGNAALHREWWRTVIETTAPNLSLCDNVSLASMYSPVRPRPPVGAPRAWHRGIAARSRRARVHRPARHPVS